MGDIEWGWARAPCVYGAFLDFVYVKKKLIAIDLRSPDILVMQPDMIRLDDMEEFDKQYIFNWSNLLVGDIEVVAQLQSKPWIQEFLVLVT